MTVFRSRSEILIHCIGCAINKNKKSNLSFPKHRQKNSTLTVSPVVWKKNMKIIFASREGYLCWWSKNPSISALRDFRGV